jgi:hypothetical protein
LTAIVIIIITLLLAVTLWAVFRKPSPQQNTLESIQAPLSPDHILEPIISYSLYVLDTRSNKRIEMHAPEEFSNQFGILSGQSVELHWNVLNADWISIDGVGFVQAIGRKEFYPSANTKYRIIAKNRHHSSETQFYVRVFPVPVMEKLFVPVPELLSGNIHLYKSPVPSLKKFIKPEYPTLNIPSIIEINRINIAQKPVMLQPDKEQISKLFQTDKKDYASFKARMFDRMDAMFKDNYKIRDIIQTIRKHYE